MFSCSKYVAAVTLWWKELIQNMIVCPIKYTFIQRVWWRWPTRYRCTVVVPCVAQK